MKIYVGPNGLHYRAVDGYWEFWCTDHWMKSNLESGTRHSLKLVGNNFRLK